MSFSPAVESKAFFPHPQSQNWQCGYEARLFLSTTEFYVAKMDPVSSWNTGSMEYFHPLKKQPPDPLEPVQSCWVVYVFLFLFFVQHGSLVWCLNMRMLELLHAKTWLYIRNCHILYWELHTCTIVIGFAGVGGDKSMSAIIFMHPFQVYTQNVLQRIKASGWRGTLAGGGDVCVWLKLE